MSKPTGGIVLTPIDVAGIAVMVAATFLAYWFGVAPVQRQLVQAVTDRQELESRAAALDSVDLELRATNAELERAKATLEEKEVQLEPASQLNVRLKALTGIAEEGGLKVNEISPGAVTLSGRYNRVAIKLSGEAGYAEFARFIAGVHSRFKETAVVNFTLVGRPEEPDADAQFGLELVWFTSPDGASSSRTSGNSGGSDSAAKTSQGPTPDP